MLIDIRNSEGCPYKQIRFKPNLAGNDPEEDRSTVQLCLGNSEGLRIWILPLDRSRQISDAELFEHSGSQVSKISNTVKLLV